MDERRLDIIEQKLEKQAESLHSIDRTLIRQEEHLKEHMRRTEAAEKNLDLLRSEIKPIKKHVDAFNAVLKFIGGLALILGMALTATNLYEKLSGETNAIKTKEAH